MWRKKIKYTVSNCIVLSNQGNTNINKWMLYAVHNLSWMLNTWINQNSPYLHCTLHANLTSSKFTWDIQTTGNNNHLLSRVKTNLIPNLQWILFEIQVPHLLGHDTWTESCPRTEIAGQSVSRILWAIYFSAFSICISLTVTNNIGLFHVDDTGWCKRKHVFPTGLCPNCHLKAHDTMEGALEAWELDGDSGGAQLVVKVRGHIDGLSGNHCLLQIVWSIHYYACKQKKIRNISYKKYFKSISISDISLMMNPYNKRPEALTVTWVSETLHWLLVKRAHICISTAPS